MSILLLLLLLTWVLQLTNGGTSFTLEIHHRFSNEVRNWSNQTGNWPQKGSIEYYSILANHDRSKPLTFSHANATYRISSLGFLYYTSVTLGRPGTKFMVALDTGNDLFWVPCRCSSIAHHNDFELSIYDPDESSTSRYVTCNNDLCPQQDICTGFGTSSNCRYHVSYVLSETSTSGILVEDVLHLTTLDDNPKSVEAYVMFGCGQVQTGSFLDVAAPNGVFGLGFEKISLPSVLTRKGYIANSFSMCFGHDGIGRITFGDKGSIEQEVTPFKMNPYRPAYNVVVTQVRVGTTVLDSEFTALVDSGTSFTHLDDPIYTLFSESSGPDTSLVPSMSLTLAGGGQLIVNDPIIVISTLVIIVIPTHMLCFAFSMSRFSKSPELNIIGQNFMTGYRIVFDRENLVLGWLKSDCYDMRDANTNEPKPANYANAPPLRNGNTSLRHVASPLYRFMSSVLVSLIVATCI